MSQVIRFIKSYSRHVTATANLSKQKSVKCVIFFATTFFESHEITAELEKCMITMQRFKRKL